MADELHMISDRPKEQLQQNVELERAVSRSWTSISAIS